MKRFFVTFFLAICAISANAQTIKALGYNTNGNIVAATNVVWTNAFNFSTNTVAAQVRTNLSLGWSALTNTNNATTLLGYTTNNNVVMPTNLVFTNEIQLGGNSKIVGLFGGPTIEMQSLIQGTGFRAVLMSSTNTIDNSTYNGTNYFLTVSALGTNVAVFRPAATELLVPLEFNNTTNAAVTRTNLGLGTTNSVTFAAISANGASLTNLSATNLSGVVAVANGGTGASNAATARTNLFGHGGITTNVSVVGTNNTNTLVFTNGILSEVQ